MDHARRLRDDLKNGRLEVFDKAGHFLPIDIPDEVARHIAAFISNETAAGESKT